MKIGIANYATPKFGKPRRLTLVAPVGIQGLFTQSLRIDGWVGDLIRFKLLDYEKSSHHWGKDIRGSRKIELPHDNKRLVLFGLTQVEATITEDGAYLDVPLPQKPTAVRSRKLKTVKVDHEARGEAVREHFRNLGQPVSPEMTLRQAVEAVNRHKSLLGDDLALRIDSNGMLKALVEY